MSIWYFFNDAEGFARGGCSLLSSFKLWIRNLEGKSFNSGGP